jgi:uncharacterized repeat protein (TIGR03843 family)
MTFNPRSDQSKGPSNSLAPDQVLAVLKHGEIVSHSLIPMGSNYTFLVNLHTQGVGELSAIYKPMRGERTLWDFPRGTLYRREYATYVVSQELGWDFVPLTIIRDGPYGVGSIQLFIPSEPDVTFFDLRDTNPEEMQNIAVLDLLVNNADRKGGHCLRGLDGGIWAIDHGLTFNVMPKLRTVIWDYAGEVIPENLQANLLAVSRTIPVAGGFWDCLFTVLHVEEVEAFHRRILNLLERPIFPSPRSYMDIPWPLI